MINLPARLIVWASAGVFTSEAGPTASTLPSRAISAAFSTAGLPEPSMRRAPTKAFTPAEVAAWPAEGRSTAKAARPAQASDKQRLIHKALSRIITPFKSKRAILRRWYGTARVSKRLTYDAAACLRARYCTILTCSDSKQGEFNREPSPLAIEDRIRGVSNLT